WLDDSEKGSKPYQLPDGAIIPARSFLLFFRRQTGVALNNNNDAARLLAPDGVTEIDRWDYNHSQADIPWSRTIDGAGEWTEDFPPSPGQPNQPPPPTATPTVTPTPWPTPSRGAIKLNEILPAPKNMDWNDDGQAGANDEWIEIYNSGDYATDLAGWRLQKGRVGPASAPEGLVYEFPVHTLIPARGFLVVFQSQSKLFLPNRRGALLLTRPDGRIVDSVTWQKSPGYDRSIGRYPDGAGPWRVMEPSMGAPNRFPSTPTPAPAPPQPPTAPSDPGLGVGVEPIERINALAIDTRMTVEGRVTAPPGLFGSRVAYIEDETGGVKLYLRRGEFPALKLGDRVRATGYIHEFRGQRELTLPNPRWFIHLGSGARPRPRFVPTGRLDMSWVGRLVLTSGQVTGFRRNSFWLDDGSGSVRIMVDAKLPWKRPFFERGEHWAVIGVVSRWNDEIRILPRYSTDIMRAPDRLPLSGAARGEQTREHEVEHP
ncbi:MAG: hypothetical protein GXP42_11940, partial [Chloroflexi bacterium]|nr:hypothetical protein [Chloroflexota bacterium]